MTRGRSLESSPRSLPRSCSRESVCSLLSSSSSFSDSPERNNPMDIVVKGLTRNVNTEHLRDIFSSFGIINCIKIDDGDREWRYKRSGVINFSSEKAAALSIECMDGGQIDGMDIEVAYLRKGPENDDFAPRRSLSSKSAFSKRRLSPGPRHNRGTPHRPSIVEYRRPSATPRPLGMDSRRQDGSGSNYIN
ncbi:RNA-binding protein with serine-rich domain 1 [Mitosporidium daphniae]|uniref:RNA recognition motif RNP 1 n=1 Tax=Mitosporidium daphniae TaxID=1485682 RepID=A0A098VTJ2_9MICR|nr:RNA recognition motif RNP 1 [Mitosporidium daphniae]KGG51041.1 RNA recognition motif RNP 1 [Mitosporidium daphniae]|eukprot:XP_013237468.1 RNA recognition motif RNP 1 [Mitosporidium daphniae]